MNKKKKSCKKTTNNEESSDEDNDKMSSYKKRVIKARTSEEGGDYQVDAMFGNFNRGGAAASKSDVDRNSKNTQNQGKIYNEL